MMVLTTKVNLKKILLILGAAALLILGLIFLLGDDPTTATGAPAMSSNDDRVKFLADLGWQVAASPTESSQVRIPEAPSAVFNRYNDLQKSQGYDLSQFAGKNVMRYVYKITGQQDSAAPVYATVLVYKNKVIGGDITDTAPNGKVRPFRNTKPPQAEKIDNSAA